MSYRCCHLCGVERPVGGLKMYEDKIPYMKPPEVYWLCDLCDKAFVQYINKQWTDSDARTIVGSINRSLNTVRKEIEALKKQK